MASRSQTIRANAGIQSMLTVVMVSNIDVWPLCPVRLALSITLCLPSACWIKNLSNGRHWPLPNWASSSARLRKGHKNLRSALLL